LSPLEREENGEEAKKEFVKVGGVSGKLGCPKNLHNSLV
jgi:hypothetical protein